VGNSPRVANKTREPGPRTERSLIAVVTDRGRVTLPAPARRRLDLEPGDQLAVVVRESSLELIPLAGVCGGSRWLLTRRVRAGIEGAEDDLESGRFVALRSALSVRRAVNELQALSMPKGPAPTELQFEGIESAVTTPAAELNAIDSLVLTHQFATAYGRLRPAAQRYCDRILRRLLDSPTHPGVRLEPVPSPTGYHVLRFGFNDRAIVRFSESTAILVDAFSFMEVARWNARAARRS